MKCKKCGTRYNENVNFCIVCGAPLEEEKRNNTKVILISVIASFVVCAVFFLVWTLAGGEDEDAQPSEPVAAAQDGSSDESYSGENNDAFYDGGYDEEYDEGYEEPYGVATDASEFIFSDSDTRYLTNSDLAYLTEDELLIARNEIFARRGRMFDDDDLRRYFTSKSWYEGTIAPDDFSEDMLSDVEKYNVELILEEEEFREGI